MQLKRNHLPCILIYTFSYIDIAFAMRIDLYIIPLSLFSQRHPDGPAAFNSHPWAPYWVTAVVSPVLCVLLLLLAVIMLINNEFMDKIIVPLMAAFVSF